MHICHIRHVALCFIFFIAFQACTTSTREGAVINATNLPNPSEGREGEIFVIDMKPSDLESLLEAPAGIDVSRAIPILAAAHTDTIDTQYVEKSVVVILRGPLKPGTHVKVEHEMRLLSNRNSADWSYDYYVGADTKTIPMIILNGFRIKLPAKISFNAYVDDKLAATRTIHAR